jgi:phage terminase small subunit
MAAMIRPAHEAFAQHYCVSGNTRKAAEAAGFSGNVGSQMLRRPDIQKRIMELNEQQFAHVGVTAETVKAELARIAFSSGADLFDSNGRMIPIQDLPDDVAATITQIDVEVIRGKDGEPGVEIRKIKRADKGAALAILARHYKVVGDEDDGINVLANVLADRLNEAKQRRLAGQNVEDAQIIEPRQIVDSSVAEPIPLLQENSDEERLW